MDSNLKWQFGFGWFSVWIFLTLAVNVFYSDGYIRVVLIFLSIISLLYMIYTYKKWNGSNWRKIHFRGMLLFSQLAAMEMAAAEAEDRDYDLKEVCRQLGIGICGEEKQFFIWAMVDHLYKDNGDYCFQLMKEYCPNLQINNLATKISFGPQLVMCNIIENSYGGEEAAEYIKALISGTAR